MKHYLGSTALALVLASGVAVAQDQRMPNQPNQGTGDVPPQSRPNSEPKGRDAGIQRAQKQGTKDQTTAPSTKGETAAERRGDERKSGRAADRDGADKSRRTGENSSSEKHPDAGNKRATENSSKTKRARAANKKEDNRQDERAAKDGGNSSTATNGMAEKSGKAGNQTAREQSNTQSRTTARVDLNDQQRDRVRNVIRDQRPKRTTNVNVEVRVGARVPRNVTLAVLPAAAVSVVPEYRNYRYIYIDDRIAIVDPTTYEIVYVLDENSRGPARSGIQRAALELTPAEQNILVRELAREGTSQSFNYRLALGAEVPNSVELRVFPSSVLADVHKLDSYRYVVTENDILVIDPKDRQIELIVGKR